MPTNDAARSSAEVDCETYVERVIELANAVDCDPVDLHEGIRHCEAIVSKSAECAELYDAFLACFINAEESTYLCRDGLLAIEDNPCEDLGEAFSQADCN